MTEEYLKELGLEGDVIEAIMGRLRVKEEEDRAKQDKRREVLCERLMDRAGVKGGLARRAVMAAMLQGEDEMAVLDELRKSEPSMFVHRAPYYATAMREEEGDEVKLSFGVGYRVRRDEK